MERAFRAGALRVLAATSTLAAGVNLPAARVLIRQAYMGIDTNLLGRCEVGQMAGRAGRKGLDESGEAILFAKAAARHAAEAVKTCCRHRPRPVADPPSLPEPGRPSEVARVTSLIQDGLDDVGSCLVEERRGMRRALLEVIATGAVATPADVMRFIKCTLLAATADYEVLLLFPRRPLPPRQMPAGTDPP